MWKAWNKDLDDTRLWPKVVLIYGNSFPDAWGSENDFLTESEQSSLDNKWHHQRVYNKILCKAVLRRYCSNFLFIHPKDVQFWHNSKGKPYVKNLQFSFNVSYTDTSFIIAFSKEARVGVDIEMIDNFHLNDTFLDYTFTKNEISSFSSTVDVLDLWTKKEAVLKYLGLGLVEGLAQFEVNHYVKTRSLQAYRFACPNKENGTLITKTTERPLAIQF
jgi:phosphopantetheinyl transferase